MSAQVANFEVRLTALDKPTSRRRWNSDALASEEASRALAGAVTAFEASLKADGFLVVRVGYGVSAQDIDEAEADALLAASEARP